MTKRLIQSASLRPSPHESLRGSQLRRRGPRRRVPLEARQQHRMQLRIHRARVHRRRALALVHLEEQCTAQPPFLRGGSPTKTRRERQHLLWVGERAGRPGGVARRHEQRHAAERPDVALAPDILLQHLLRRHEVGRAFQRVVALAHGAVRPEPLGRAKVRCRHSTRGLVSRQANSSVVLSKRTRTQQMKEEDKKIARPLT